MRKPCRSGLGKEIVSCDDRVAPIVESILTVGGGLGPSFDPNTLFPLGEAGTVYPTGAFTGVARAPAWLEAPTRPAIGRLPGGPDPVTGAVGWRAAGGRILHTLSSESFVTRAVLVGLAAAAIGSTVLAQDKPESLGKPLAVGEAAPDFTLKGATKDGLLPNPVALKDYRGKTVVLAFFFKARTKG